MDQGVLQDAFEIVTLTMNGQDRHALEILESLEREYASLDEHQSLADAVLAAEAVRQRDAPRKSQVQ